jgi:hypothetical protein
MTSREPRRSNLMRVFVDNDQHAADLLAHLTEQASFVVARTSALEISVGVLGSFADGGAEELAAHLDRWRVHHPDVELQLEKSSVTPSADLEAHAQDLLEHVLRMTGRNRA